jgi:hypothetical protein
MHSIEKKIMATEAKAVCAVSEFCPLLLSNANKVAVVMIEIKYINSCKMLAF